VVGSPHNQTAEVGSHTQLLLLPPLHLAPYLLRCCLLHHPAVLL
jgi:hypothetical protein